MNFPNDCTSIERKFSKRYTYICYNNNFMLIDFPKWKALIGNTQFIWILKIDLLTVNIEFTQLYSRHVCCF